MEPLIRSGDVLTIEPMPDRDPKLGEVIAFVEPNGGRMYVHRAVDRVSSGWVMRGDNSPHADGVFPRDAMVGLVRRVERNHRVVQAGIDGAETVVPVRGTLQRTVVTAGWVRRWVAEYIVRHVRAPTP